MNKKIIKNYGYNFAYQVFLLIVPLLLTPYVARVLGEDRSGQYSFALSINNYFTLFAALGFQYYAQRLVASHQNDRLSQSVVFWELMILRFFSVLISLMIHICILLSGAYGPKYATIMLILSINIIAVAFDSSFFFQGNEMFGKLVLRNIAVKAGSISAIFLFVKKPEDLWIYTLIMSLSVLLAAISLLFYLPAYLEKISFRELHPLKHLKPALILFLPTVATSVYMSLDKTMIGVITKIDAENGNYEYAEKLVKILLTAITSLGAVIIPGNSKRFAEGNLAEIKNNINNSIRFVLFIGFPLMFGSLALSDMIVPWFLGEGYDKASSLIRLLSPLILIIGFSNVFGVQILIPSKQDKRFTIAICCGAVLNFLLNIVLISQWMSFGAAIASVLAELLITVIMGFWTREYYTISNVCSVSVKYFFSSVIMCAVCYYLSRSLEPLFINTLLVAILGAGIYFGLLFILKDSFFREIIQTVRRVIHK